MSLPPDTSTWTEAQYQRATADDIRLLDSTQVSCLAHPDWLTTSAAGGFSASRIPFISVSWELMGADWLNALSVDAFASIPTAGINQLQQSAVVGLDHEHAAALTVQQLGALTRADWLSPDAVAALSDTQVKAIQTGDWQLVTSDWLNALSLRAFAGIPAAGFSQIPGSVLAKVDTDHIAAVGREQFRSLEISQVAALTPEQCAALSTDCISQLSVDQLGALSNNVQAFTAAQIAALPLGDVKAMKPEQLGALGVSAGCGLTTEQIISLGTNIRHLGSAAISALPVWVIRQIPAPQISSLSIEQVAAMGVQQLAALSPAQVCSLTPGQLTALGPNLQSLSSHAVASLKADSLIGIYSQLSNRQFAGLRDDQKKVVQSAYSHATTMLRQLSSEGILDLVQRVVATGESLFSYTAALTVLKGTESIIGESGLSQAQLKDLQTFTSTVGEVAGENSYVFSILNRLVNGDPSNANWTGGEAAPVTLGNLQVGSTQDQFEKLIGKWFLGTDHATEVDFNQTSMSYKASDAPLFAIGGPKPSDVNQGWLGDCYLMAAMIATAQHHPEKITSMFTDNGNGTYGVRFYDTGGRPPVYVTVDREFPDLSASNPDNTNAHLGMSSTGTDWVPMLEKAFVAVKNVAGGTPNTYGSINGGYGVALGGITGQTVMDVQCLNTDEHEWNTSIKDSVIKLLNGNQEVMYNCHLKPTNDAGTNLADLVSDHMYEVEGYDRTTDKLILRNPWGVLGDAHNTTFEVSMANLWGGGTDDPSNSGFIATVPDSSGIASRLPAAWRLVEAMAATSPPAAGGTDRIGQQTGTLPHAPALFASTH